MKSKSLRRFVYTLIMLLGLFMIFFVGREYNSETGKNKFIITNKGLQHFRKGLDVSGGVRLVYKINYDKYEHTYSDQAQLSQIKNNVETIIKKNIDKRISGLGVSDYNSFSKTIDGEEHIIIELGGISNLDEAKEIIGKTVELEFRLPNEGELTQEEIQQRKKLATNIYKEVIENPDLIEKIGGNRKSENVFYNYYTGQTISQLPYIYQDNIKILEDLEPGEVYEGILEGLYLSVPQEDGSQVDLEGYTIFKIVDKQEQNKNKINPQDIVVQSQKYDLDLQNKVIKNTYNIKPNNYKYQSGKIVFNVQDIANLQKAYKSKIYQIPKPQKIGKSDIELEQLQEEYDKKIELVEKQILNNSNIQGISGINLFSSGWIAQQTLKQNISSFEDIEKLEEVKKIEELGATYLIYATQKKSESEKMAQYLILDGVSENIFNKIEKDFETETIYMIKDIFIQNKETWTPAIDPKTNKILNGAYFEMARTEVNEFGEHVVLIDFNAKGKEIFCNITEANIKNQMAIFIGGELLTAPTIQSKICGGSAQIDGGFTSESAKDLVDNLNEGTMPAPLILLSEEKISPTLGAYALNGAMLAGLIGLVAIVLYILFLYGFKKAIISFIVIINFMIILLMIMKLINYSLSLSGIAAIMLSIGIGIDANILIFERIREELKDKKTIKSAISTGYTRSLAPIKDGNISTGLVALLLYAFGINMFKGFGSMMIINILLILFINVPLTRELLYIFFHSKKEYKKGEKTIIEG